MADTISTNLDHEVAVKARQIAQRENRTVSNFVAGAVGVFSDFPKELRDILLELRASNDSQLLRDVMREMTFVVARARFDAAAAKLAREGKFDVTPEASDMDLLEVATAMTKGS
ncbi:hypothetical protein AB4144_05075 [Rhizobiaceae sp. 2RAB30]